MNQKHLLRFIKYKLKTEPNTEVMVRDGVPITLKQVNFEICPYHFMTFIEGWLDFSRFVFVMRCLSKELYRFSSTMDKRTLRRFFFEPKFIHCKCFPSTGWFGALVVEFQGENFSHPTLCEWWLMTDKVVAVPEGWWPRSVNAADDRWFLSRWWLWLMAGDRYCRAVVAFLEILPVVPATLSTLI
jgi:hypothetical protein